METGRYCRDGITIPYDFHNFQLPTYLFKFVFLKSNKFEINNTYSINCYHNEKNNAFFVFNSRDLYSDYDERTS
ncbi:hypothetical protein CRS_27350 [Chryseobacterium sp. ON_d1]|nr:hypothetical protein CRS_27350 [Chryseobacterium sp. ON_d1]